MAAEESIEVQLARLAGRMDGMEARLKIGEEWQASSAQFHKEIRQRNDRYDGEQVAEHRIQERRHEENIDRLDAIGKKVARQTLWWTVIGALAVIVGIVLAAKHG